MYFSAILNLSHPVLPLLCLQVILYVCVSIPALQIGSSVPFSRFHIYVLIYDICFSLSDLLHSIEQVLGSSTSVQLIQIHNYNEVSPHTGQNGHHQKIYEK